MATGKRLEPEQLPLGTRRLIGGELVQALRARRWISHTRALGSNDSNFRVLGAHASTTRREDRTEVVERYLPLVMLPDARVNLPMLAVLLSGSAYAAAEKEAGQSWLSLTHLLKYRATSPYKVDTDKGGYRVRKMPRSGATEGALDALDVLVRHCIVVDVAPALANAFEDALAEMPGAGDVRGALLIIQQQLGVSTCA